MKKVLLIIILAMVAQSSGAFATTYTYECAKQSLAVSAAESAAKEKASHHPYTVDLRAWE